MKQLVGFNNNEFNNLIWSSLTDQIRGGRSMIEMEIQADGAARFFGQLILNNEGAGFASYRVRKKDQTFWNLKDFSALNILCCGDGRTYKILLKDQTADQSETNYSWQAKIQTSAEFMMTAIALAGLRPFYRGKEMKDISAFDSSRIVEIGFQINDKKEGPFEFQIKAINSF